jgi:hypothetical protein
MAKKRINKDEVAPKDIFKNVEDGAKLAKAQVDQLSKSVQVLQQAAKKIKTDIIAAPKPKDIKSVKVLEALQKRANQTAKAKLQIDEKLIKEKVKLQQLNAKQNKQIKEEIALAKTQKGSLERLRLESKKLRGEKEKLNLTTKKGQERLKQINLQLDRNNLILEKNATKLGKQKIGIGRYEKALGGLKNMLGKLGLAFGAITLIRDSFSTIKDFEQGQADLASVLGVNTDEMARLTEQAKELGATTTFTATQVSELQKEFAKLGFTQAEIENVTEATLLLAEATGTELARAAEVAGGVLNGFGLDSVETQRVVDVMAASFSKSGLDMEKFAETMKTAAPIAKASGVSLEVATAAAGKLADNMISGSKAGTDLKIIFSELVKDGKPFEDSLDDISKKLAGAATPAEKLAIAEELVGNKAKGALLILAEQKDGLTDLKDELLDADGAAEKMAETQRKTLGGALKLLSSAWDGIILKMNEAGGVGDKLRRAVVFLSENLESIISVIGKVVRGFVLFKVTMKALELNDKIKNFKALKNSVADTGKSLTEAQKGAKAFGGALKGIGLSIAISVLVEAAMAFYDIASGAARARYEVNLFNETAAKGAEKFGAIISNNKQLLKDEVNAIRQKGLLQAEEDKLIAKATEKSRKRLENQINNARTIKKANEEQIKIEEERLKGLEDSFSSFSEFFSVTKEQTLELEKQKNKIAELKAANQSFDSGIRLLRDSYKDINQEVIDQNIAIDKNNAAKKESIELDKEKVKSIKRVKVAAIKERELDTSGAGAIAARIKAINDETFTRAMAVADIRVLNAEIDRDDKELTEAKIERIKVRLKEETSALAEGSAERIKLEKEAELEIRALREQGLQESVDRQNAILQQGTDVFIQLSDQRIEQINKEIAAAEKQRDFLKEAAAQGNITAKESIAEQNRIIREGERERIEQEKRKQQILFISSVLQAYNSNLAAGDDSTTAFAKAVGSNEILSQYIGSLAQLPAFLEGIEDTGSNGLGVDGKGGFHAILHPNERVLTKEQNQKIGNISNNELAAVMEQHRLGNFVDGNQISVGWGTGALVDRLMSVEQKLDAVNTSIKNKPVPNIEAGEIIQGAMTITHSTQKGGTTTNRRFKVRGK